MKRRSPSLLLILFTFSIYLHSQDYDIQWGPEYKYSRGIVVNKCGGFDDEGYHLLKQSFRNAELLSFNLDNELIENQELTYAQNKGFVFILQLIDTQKGTFGVFRAREKLRSDVHTLVSPLQGNDFGELESIHVQTYQAWWSREKSYAGGQTGFNQDLYDHVSTSLDKSKVIVTSSLNPRATDQQEILSVNVFDANFELLWKTDYPFIVADNEIQVMHAAVSNTGEAYFLVRQKLDSGGGGLSKRLPIFQYTLHQVAPDHSEVITLSLGDDLAIQSIEMILNDEGGLTLAGMYTPAEDQKQLTGIFNQKISTSFTVEQVNTFPFEPAFVESLSKQRNPHQDQGLETDFLIKSFFELSDGTLGFIAEKTYLKTRGGPRSTDPTSYFLNTDELIIAIFEADLNSMNILKIDKEFESSAQGGNSYVLGLAPDALILVYNTFKIETTGQKIMSKLTSPTVFTDLTVVDRQGKIIQQKTILDSREAENFFYPNSSFSNENALLLYLAAGKYYQFGSLSLETNK